VITQRFQESTMENTNNRNGNKTSETALARRAETSEVQHYGELTIEDLIARKAKIDEVITRAMVRGEDFGQIPGCGPKPALLKAGAEKLCTIFGLAPEFDDEIIELGDGHREVRITCTLRSIGSGVALGQGVGSCSTRESKYRWRGGSRLCPECGAAAITKSKFDDCGWFCFHKKGGCGAKWPVGAKEIEDQTTDRVENPDIADQWNTVLKMAKKRAHVDATLTVTGASHVLTQDIDDLQSDVDDAEYRDADRRGERPSRADQRELDRWGRDEQTMAMDRGDFVAATDLDDLERELSAELHATKTEDEVRALAERCNKVPKGTPTRERLFKLFTKKIAEHQASQPRPA
jgi:hypothetical protein